MFGNEVIFDIEGDGLVPSKIYVLAYYDVAEKELGFHHDYGSMNEELKKQIVVGHNIIRFDRPCLERITGLKLEDDVLLVDTLAVSWFLEPERKSHSLDSYSSQFGIEKPKIENWENLPLEEYTHRCVEDVKLTAKLWQWQYTKLFALYQDVSELKRFLKYLQFKMECAQLQEAFKWKFDLEKASSNLNEMIYLRDAKVQELKSCLPPVPITHVMKRPAKLYKADKTMTEVFKRFHTECLKQGLDPFTTDSVTVIKGYSEPNPSSPSQIKDWLFSIGWVPRTFKTNSSGDEVPQISKSKQEGGGVCDSIKDLYEKEPGLQVLDGLYVLNHRISLLNGLIDNASLTGYATAAVQGFTNTLRFKHSGIVNLPKIDTPHGDKIRCTLIAPEGYELCGSDQASLEDRTKQHFMYFYDPEYVKEMMVPDFDPHIDIAIQANMMSKEDGAFYKSYNSKTATPEDKEKYARLKSVRSIAKNANYACVYGAGPPRISKTAGISLEQARLLHEAYWKRNQSVKKTAESCRTRTVAGMTFLFNPVSKFWYVLRNDKDRFSTLNQGTGVYCFDRWLYHVIKRRRQLTAQFHDEGVWCLKKGFREQMTKILLDALKDTNEELKLNRELDIGIDFGDNYADIH